MVLVHFCSESRASSRCLEWQISSDRLFLVIGCSWYENVTHTLGCKNCVEIKCVQWTKLREFLDQLWQWLPRHNYRRQRQHYDNKAQQNCESPLQTKVDLSVVINFTTLKISLDCSCLFSDNHVVLETTLLTWLYPGKEELMQSCGNVQGH